MSLTKTQITGIAVGVGVLVAVIISIAVPLSLSGVGGGSAGEGLLIIPAKQISFIPDDPSTFTDKLQKLTDFLEPYKNLKPSGNVIACNDTTEVPEQKTCLTSAENIFADTDCYRHDYWGFNASKPCLIFSFDKPDFVPEEYEDWEHLPDDMPAQLQSQIKERWFEHRKSMEKTLWIHCTEAMRYSGRTQGFKLYELRNPLVEGHLNPVTNIVFDFTKKRGQKFDVECGVWAKNIDHQKDKWAKLTFTVDMQ